MPACGGNDVRYIRPRSCSSAVTATSRCRSARGACTETTGSVAAGATAGANNTTNASVLARNGFDIVPITSRLERYFQRNGQRQGFLHVLTDQLRDGIALRRRDFKD